MAKDRLPWWRKERGCWYVWHDGEQIKLHPDKETAYRLWHRLAAGVEERPHGPTVGEVIEAYLSDAAGRLKPSTLLSKRKVLDRLKDAKGRTPAVTLSATTALSWLDAQRGWGRSVRWLAVCVVKTCFRWAVCEGMLADSLVAKLRVKGPVSRGSSALVQADTHARLMESAPQPLREVLTALHATGCRPSEVCGVEARHFDATAGVWILDEHKTTHKTHKPRVVHLTPELVALCRRLAAERPTGPLFRNTKGTPVRPQSLRLWLFKTCRRLGMPKVIPYGYRHTYATDALAAGVPDAQAAELLGHSTQTLHKHYAHLTAKATVLRQALSRVRQ